MFSITALAIYSNTPSVPTKRNSSGMASHSRDAQAAAEKARAHFNAFLATLREPLAVSVALSLLAKIYNLVVDDSTTELVIDYTNLWPSNISNMNNCNSKHVLESITNVLDRSLKLYPYNTTW